MRKLLMIQILAFMTLSCIGQNSNVDLSEIKKLED